MSDLADGILTIETLRASIKEMHRRYAERFWRRDGEPPVFVRVRDECFVHGHRSRHSASIMPRPVGWTPRPAPELDATFPRQVTT